MAKRKAGRPRKDFDFLAMEVHRVMRAFDVGADEACRRISIGWKAPVMWTDRNGKRHRAMTLGSPWKGIKPATLARRYWRWRDAEQKRQDENNVTDKIPERLTS